MKNAKLSPVERAYQNAKAQVQITYPSSYALSVDEGFVIAGAGPLLKSEVTEVGAWMEYANWIKESPSRIAAMESEAKASFGILAFERDTQIEMARQLARHWVIAHHLRTGHLPNNGTFYSYPIGWGETDNGPMHGKRVVMKLTIEDEAKS